MLENKFLWNDCSYYTIHDSIPIPKVPPIQFNIIFIRILFHFFQSFLTFFNGLFCCHICVTQNTLHYFISHEKWKYILRCQSIFWIWDQTRPIRHTSSYSNINGSWFLWFRAASILLANLWYVKDFLQFSLFVAPSASCSLFTSSLSLEGVSISKYKQN